MARPPVIEPVATIDPGHGTRYTHPSFGQVSAHRISGSRVLYGSDFAHHNYIRISVTTSELKRDLAHDWHHNGKHIVEFDLSEAQWATFISSMNMGGGTPCTFSFIKGEGMMPDLPLPSRGDQFKGEVDDHLKEIVTHIKDALDEIDALGIPKGKAAAIKAKLSKAHQHATSNIGFVSKSFEQHVERTVETAKVEIHGYMNGTLQAAGLEHLQSRPIALEAQKDETDA